MKITLALCWIISTLLSACASPTPLSTPTSTPTSPPTFTPASTTIPIQATLVLTNATLIDGTGADPIPDAVVVIADERIIAVGPRAQVEIPAGVQVIDLEGAFVLPGFINAHVHNAYDAGRLEAWAQAGVTTVRDEGIIFSSAQLADLIALRDQWAALPEYARLVSTGYMLTVPGGYGQLAVTSAEDARNQVNMELDAGVDLIKLAIETGYAGTINLPNFTREELAAIIAAAHARGRLVTAHVTQAQYLQQVVTAGVDDAAHIPADYITGGLIREMVEQDIYLVPTLTVLEAYGGLSGATYNLGRMAEAGVSIALGNDYTFIPQNNFDHFDLGMPMHEITRMSEAGMTPMQIIVAATRNAAHVCGLEQELGTLEAGKLADMLILSADPLQDLAALTQVQMVIHSGVIIRPGTPDSLRGFELNSL